jgi:hypothetical protein
MNYSLGLTPSGDKIEFAAIKGRLDDSDIEALVGIGAMEWIQADFMPVKEDLTRLNEAYFKRYPETGFRVYELIAGDGGAPNPIVMRNIQEISAGYPETAYRLHRLNAVQDDVSSLAVLSTIQKLEIETMGAANHLEVLSQLPHLKKLFLSAYMCRDFAFLKDLPNTLEYLSLETKSAALDLSELLRFHSLKSLRLCRYKKNIDRLSELVALESLTLRGVTPGSFAFVNRMASLRRLRVQLGAAADFSELDGNASIIALQLCRISNMDNVDVIAKLPYLEAALLAELPHIDALPDLSESRLKHVLLLNMKALTDLSALEHAPALESVSIAQCPRAFESSDIMPVLRNPSVRSCSFYTSSDKRNQAINQLIAKYGKMNINNFMTTRKVIFDGFAES